MDSPSLIATPPAAELAPAFSPRTRAASLPLLSVVTLALLVRLALLAAGPWAHPSRALEPDSPRYLELAGNLASFGSFSKSDENAGLIHVPLAQMRDRLGQLPPRDAHGLRPELFRTPGYPAFLALLMRLGWAINAALVAQAIFATAGVALVYLIALRLLASRSAALLAALILALSPADIVASNTLLSEPLFTLILLTALWLLVRRPITLAAAATAGLLLGLSILVRPVSILLAPALAAWLLLHDRRRATWAAAAFLVLASFLPPALWAWRNATVGNGFRISSVGSLSSLFYTAGYTDISARGGDTLADWPAEVHALLADLDARARPAEDLFTTADHLAADRLRAHPRAYASALALSSFKFFTDHSVGALYARLGEDYHPPGLRSLLLGRNLTPPGPALDHRAAALGIAWLAANAALTLLMLVGWARLLRARRWHPAVLLAGVVLYFLLTTQTSGMERFRLPVLGLQAIAAAAAFMPRGSLKVPKQAPPSTVYP